jgi:hypothetical protein
VPFSVRWRFILKVYFTMNCQHTEKNFDIPFKKYEFLKGHWHEKTCVKYAYGEMPPQTWTADLFKKISDCPFKRCATLCFLEINSASPSALAREKLALRLATGTEKRVRSQKNWVCGLPIFLLCPTTVINRGLSWLALPQEMQVDTHESVSCGDLRSASIRRGKG